MKRMNRIPFKKINLGKADEAIRPLLESGFIGLGNTVFEFEKALAQYVGAKHVIAVDSCTSALFLSLKYEILTKGIKHVSIPSMTVPLVADAVAEAGLTFEFNGMVSWVGSAYPLLGTDVIDSAHELRRDQYKRISASNPDAKLCFSFYPTKTIGSADGGAIATNDSDFAKWVRSASTYGRNQGNKYQNSWDYDVEMIGYKRHYTNLQAAICLEQLNRLDETNKRRQEIVQKYNTALSYNNDSDYLYRIDVVKRDEFIEYMLKNGVECGVHFKPLHMMTPFTQIRIFDRKHIEDAYQNTVSLPLYDLLTDDEVEKIISLVKAWDNSL